MPKIPQLAKENNDETVAHTHIKQARQRNAFACFDDY